MATASYPKISSTAWQKVRARAATAPTAPITPGSIAALLGMSGPRSALDNVVLPLRRLGLVDEDGKLTERGKKWRVDATYGEACQEILDEIYPTDLTSLTDGDGKPEKSQVNSWFQYHGFGDANATKMAATYNLIAEKQLPESNIAEPKKKTIKPAPKTKAQKPEPALAPPVSADESRAEAIASTQSSDRSIKSGPNIHLDIQIHIPADASLEQIEQIFASMGKHLYQ